MIKGSQVTNSLQAFGIDNPNFTAGRTPRIIKLSFVAYERIAGDPTNDPTPAPANGSWSLVQETANMWKSSPRQTYNGKPIYSELHIEDNFDWYAGFAITDEFLGDDFYLSWPQSMENRVAFCRHYNPFPTSYKAGDLSFDWIDEDTADTITTRAAELFPIQGKQFLDNLPQPDGTVIHRYASKFDASRIKITKNS